MAWIKTLGKAPAGLHQLGSRYTGERGLACLTRAFGKYLSSPAEVASPLNAHPVQLLATLLLSHSRYDERCEVPLVHPRVQSLGASADRRTGHTENGEPPIAEQDQRADLRVRSQSPLPNPIPWGDPSAINIGPRFSGRAVFGGRRPDSWMIARTYHFI